MKAADKYQNQVNALLYDLKHADKWTEDLGQKISDLRSKLRYSRWSLKYKAREMLSDAEDTLKDKHKPKLVLIQGGNDFLARRSKAVLTLIITSETNQAKKVG